MGGAEVAAGESILNRANIPTFPYPDTAARAFHYMWRYSDNLQGALRNPGLADDSGRGRDSPTRGSTRSCEGPHARAGRS